MALKEILSNSIKPRYTLIMLQKLKKRLFERRDKVKLQHNLCWCKKNTRDFSLLAGRMNSSLWEESEKFEKDVVLRAKEVLSKIGLDLGGGGYYSLLYFLTRHFKPGVVVETGVAAGFSSQAFLKAMQANDRGVLYSSDFPYFRLKNPEQYIGILVEEELKERWRLYINGDKKNLPKIAAQVSGVDIFHYDSDKTYSGRLFAMDIIKRLLHRGSIIVMDDIQDNSFFYDYVKDKDCFWRVFSFGSKYIGLAGDGSLFLNPIGNNEF